MGWSTGVVEAMKSQNTSTKIQVNSKCQYPMTKTYLGRYFFEMAWSFEILNFGHCDLFDI
jgi:hypothetical protein